MKQKTKSISLDVLQDVYLKHKKGILVDGSAKDIIDVLDSLPDIAKEAISVIKPFVEKEILDGNLHIFSNHGHLNFHNEKFWGHYVFPTEDGVAVLVYLNKNIKGDPMDIEGERGEDFLIEIPLDESYRILLAHKISEEIDEYEGYYGDFEKGKDDAYGALIHSVDKEKWEAFCEDKGKERKKKSEQILSNPNMTSTDKENMEKCIAHLAYDRKDTVRNLKLLESVNYGTNFIEIGGVKFSKEKLIPQVHFNSEPYWTGVFGSDTEGVKKIKYKDKDEYLFTIDGYIEQARKQGKKVITEDHIKSALDALPGVSKYDEYCLPALILCDILGVEVLKFSEGYGGFNYGYATIGIVPSSGQDFLSSLYHKKEIKDGKVVSENAGIFNYNESLGYGYPCLFIVE